MEISTIQVELESDQSKASEVDWFYCDSYQLNKYNITHRDFKQEDSRYDAIKQGYWIRIPSKTATILALKGCIFKQRMGQHNW